jgi:AbrB family looped-hinge helix DNA binding protein
MATLETTMTQKGQVTIPAKIRSHLGLKAHDKVVFELEGNVVKLRRAPSRVLRAFGSFGPVSTADILDAREKLEQSVADEVLSEG